MNKHEQNPSSRGREGRARENGFLLSENKRMRRIGIL